MTTAIILAGGNSWRLKPETSVPKPLLKIGKETLLSLQTKWLLKKGFNEIFIVTSPEVNDGIDDSLRTEFQTKIIIENERRGTAGAVSLVLPQLSGKIFYVMNCDDLVLDSDPMSLILKAEDFAGVLLAAKPKIAYGCLQTRGDLILRFAEKPVADYWVSTGHYAFNLDRINNGLQIPKFGNLEETLLPELADRRKLAVEKYRGTWITISNMKDYLDACERLSNH